MVTEFARAKINLTLDILGKRADGFHEVEMIMQTVELADVVELKKISGGINFKIDAKKIIGGEKIPADEKNLAYRAAAEVCKVCGKNLGVEINLHKKIPAAAGLGGGSADAAAVIRGMNNLFSLNFTADELCKIGARIGSDVPFCVIGGTCLAQGRGEKLTRLPNFKNIGVVLMKPHGEISTAWAYKTFDELPAPNHPPTSDVIKFFDAGNFKETFAKFSNVLELVAMKKFPELKTYKNKMIQAGAKAALVSGSGPTIFALTDEVEKVAASVAEYDAEIFLTKIF